MGIKREKRHGEKPKLVNLVSNHLSCTRFTLYEMKQKRFDQQTLVEHHLVQYEVEVEAKKYSYKISGCAVTFVVCLCNHG